MERLDMFAKIGRALGYEDCCIDSFRNGYNKTSHGGYCPCPECEKMSLEELEARLGRSVYNPPNWSKGDEWLKWSDERWAEEAENARRLKNEL